LGSPENPIANPTSIVALKRILPFLAWWPRVNRATLRADALAGLIGAVVVLPQGVAFATLAGLPPEYGLYCAMVPTLIAALFGSSWHAVSGPTNAVSLMVLTALAPLAAPGSPQYVGFALTLALLCGLLTLAFGLFRLGVLVRFVSDGVIVGFTAAIGVLIIASQAAPLVGVHTDPASSFAVMLRRLATHLGEAQPWALATGLVTIAAGAFGARFTRRMPPIVIATVFGTAFGAAVNAVLGEAASGVRTLGPLPSALPPLSLPDFSAAALGTLTGPAIAVTVLSVTQAVAIVRAVALRSGQHVDANQELIGQGLANIAAAFFSGYPTSASVNRCGINYEAGARTPLSAVFSVLLLVLLLAVLAPLAALLPLATIAALLVLAGWNLIDVGRIRLYARTSRAEAAVLGVTLLATLLAPLPYAILTGVIASLVVYLNRTSRPQIRAVLPDPRHSERRFGPLAQGLAECPQLKIVTVEGSLYFGAIDHFETHLNTLREIASGQRHLLIVSRNINFVDVAGAEALVREARARRWAGGRLWLQGLRKPVEDVLRNSGILEEIGEDAVFRDKDDALAHIFERLDPQTCARCSARIFNECSSRPQRSSA